MRSFTVATAAILTTAGLAGGIAHAAAPATTAAPTHAPAVTRVTCERTLPSYPLLMQGDRGSAVRTLQCLINDYGRNRVAVDGVYGPRTAAALERIRSAHGGGTSQLSQVTDHEWVMLLSHRLPQRTLKRGDRGQAVVDLQRTIRAAGLPIVVDGVFGRKTEAAVKRLQEGAALRDTGRADAALRKVMSTGNPLRAD